MDAIIMILEVSKISRADSLPVIVYLLKHRLETRVEPPYVYNFAKPDEVQQIGVTLQTTGPVKRNYTIRKFSSASNQIQGPVSHNGLISYRPTRETWDGYGRFKAGEKSNRIGDFEAVQRLMLGEKFHRSGDLEATRSCLTAGDKFNRTGDFEAARSWNLGDNFHRTGDFEATRGWNSGENFHRAGDFEVSRSLNSAEYFRRTGDFEATQSINSGENFQRTRDFEVAREPNRGPRARRVCSPSSSLAETSHLSVKVRRDKYNLPDFQTVYENAKFFVIKSYSEDDVHKSIKYDVWASTANGNKKLDAAFHDAETQAKDTGISCPMFLFFSVNGSGQFVGLAEMIGQVDFNKDMDFWQQDKWNGFFPVKWHIIKDIPNSKLRHIILENNDNKPVTYTRDTQEVGLQQGLEMLSIFKSYTEVTSMLDDYTFYEDQEKSILARKSPQTPSPQMDMYRSEFPNYFEARRRAELSSSSSMKEVRTDSMTSLVSLTRNLSLNSHLQRPGASIDTTKYR
ncbi:hypothetical protein GIB67_041335 [Kingdonia uniflora]|uniref:YTH domain-containing family protein n=1 Tax=Kingdonia uniflora TaxID=39325 RepID=A0A7J7NJ97_9MAGN|nr:hypothetical protein GIB67_041335 [Kingdonia uniflora]